MTVKTQSSENSSRRNRYLQNKREKLVGFILLTTYARYFGLRVDFQSSTDDEHDRTLCNTYVVHSYAQTRD